MSYLFAGYLYDKRRFSPKHIADFWANVEPCLAAERLVQVAVSPRVDAVFYFGGANIGKTLAFAYACEAFLREGYAEGPARKLLDAGNDDFQYAVWMASELTEYDVSVCFSGRDMEARAMIRGKAERVMMQGNTRQYYEVVTLAQTPDELGMEVDLSRTFDEEEYQRLLTEREEPFRPGLLVHDEIGVPRGKVMDAFSNAASGMGTVLWPEGGPIDTPELRRASVSMLDPRIPTFPLWEHLGNEPGAGLSARPAGARRKRRGG